MVGDSGCDGIQKVAGGICLEDVTRRPSAHGSVSNLAITILSDKDDSSSWTSLANDASNLYSIECRQPEIKQNEVRLKFDCFLDGVLSVADFGNNLPSWTCLQDSAYLRPPLHIIVGDQNGRRSVPCGLNTGSAYADSLRERQQAPNCVK